VVSGIQEDNIKLLGKRERDLVPAKAVVAKAVTENQGGFARVAVSIVVGDPIADAQVVGLPVHRVDPDDLSRPAYRATDQRLKDNF